MINIVPSIICTSRKSNGVSWTPKTKISTWWHTMCLFTRTETVFETLLFHMNGDTHMKTRGMITKTPDEKFNPLPCFKFFVYE